MSKKYNNHFDNTKEEALLAWLRSQKRDTEEIVNKFFLKEQLKGLNDTDNILYERAEFRLEWLNEQIKNY